MRGQNQAMNMGKFWQTQVKIKRHRARGYFSCRKRCRGNKNLSLTELKKFGRKKRKLT